MDILLLDFHMALYGSGYSNIWITCETSQRKFQQHHKLVAQLPNENYDMLISKIHTAIRLLSKRCVRGIGNIITG
jgi:hypothetical protein